MKLRVMGLGVAAMVLLSGCPASNDNGSSAVDQAALKATNDKLHDGCASLAVRTGMVGHLDKVTAYSKNPQAPYEALAGAGLLAKGGEADGYVTYTVTPAGDAALKRNARGNMVQFCSGWWQADASKHLSFVRADWLSRPDIQAAFADQLAEVEAVEKHEPALPNVADASK